MYHKLWPMTRFDIGKIAVDQGCTELVGYIYDGEIGCVDFDFECIADEGNPRQSMDEMWDYICTRSLSRDEIERYCYIFSSWGSTGYIPSHERIGQFPPYRGIVENMNDDILDFLQIEYTGYDNYLRDIMYYIFCGRGISAILWLKKRAENYYKSNEKGTRNFMMKFYDSILSDMNALEILEGLGEDVDPDHVRLGREYQKWRKANYPLPVVKYLFNMGCDINEIYVDDVRTNEDLKWVTENGGMIPIDSLKTFEGDIWKLMDVPSIGLDMIQRSLRFHRFLTKTDVYLLGRYLLSSIDEDGYYCGDVDVAVRKFDTEIHSGQNCHFVTRKNVQCGRKRYKGKLFCSRHQTIIDKRVY